MEEEDIFQEETFQDQQPRSSREASGEVSAAIAAVIREFGDGLHSVSVSPILPVNSSHPRERTFNPAGHQRPRANLIIDQVEGSPQGRLFFPSPERPPLTPGQALRTPQSAHSQRDSAGEESRENRSVQGTPQASPSPRQEQGRYMSREEGLNLRASIERLIEREERNRWDYEQFLPPREFAHATSRDRRSVRPTPYSAHQPSERSSHFGSQAHSSHYTPFSSPHSARLSHSGSQFHSSHYTPLTPHSARIGSRSPLRRTPLTHSPQESVRSPVGTHLHRSTYPRTPREEARPMPVFAHGPARPSNAQGARDHAQALREELLQAARQIAREEVALANAVPAAEEIPFGDRVSNESRVQQVMLEQLKSFYPQIKKMVNNVTQKVSYEYVFDYVHQDGYWAIPDPKFSNPSTNVPDKYGHFSVLHTPTISKYWSHSTQPVMSEADGEDNQDAASRPAVKKMDSLHKPVVPVKCSDVDMEAFLSSNPLADWKSQMHGAPEGRYLTVDPDIFSNSQYVKWDAHTFLPSVEYKTRLAVKDALSVRDMLKALNAKTRPLLVNWHKPVRECGRWDKFVGIKKEESEELVAALGELTLEESVSKADLIEELYARSRMTEVALAQLDHQAKLLEALETEAKLTIRELFLYRAIKPGSNSILKEALQNSRVSSPGLFGPVPESYKYKINNQPKFDALPSPGSFSISGPLLKKRQPFPAKLSGNRGAIPRPNTSSRQRNNYRQPGQARGAPKNARGGGRGKATRVSQPATTGGTSTRANVRPRGGKAPRGTGKGKRRS